MKPLLTEEPDAIDATSNDDSDSTSTDSLTRPSLMRAAPERLSDLSQSLTERRNNQSSKDNSKGKDDAAALSAARVVADGAAKVPQQSSRSASGTEDDKLAQLRDAMNAKLLLQQRLRRSYGSPKSDLGSSPRVAAIQEEGAASPKSINAVLARTSSNESNESTRTVRAGKAAVTSGTAPLRTPSYPFPYVPGTPKAWSTPSPATSADPTSEGDTPGAISGRLSGASTPIAEAAAFMPPGTTYDVQEDPRYPTPNLYDMVLQLNTEPGLEQWWATATNLMHDHFRADRATLVVPRDPSEIENVPWGQKATFSMNGPEEFVSPSTVFAQTLDATVGPQSMPKSEYVDDVKPQKLHRERLRPRLEARHSYAGHGREKKESVSAIRPLGPQRTVTHAAGMLPAASAARLPAQRLQSTGSLRQSSLNDPDFSSIGNGFDAGPYAEMFSNLRDLDHEVRPLIEPGGVNRVLERGRVVTVTRDYLSDAAALDDNDISDSDPESGDHVADTTPRPSIANIFGDYRSVLASDNGFSTLRDYEEYEQHPTSPWSQSPAPSPAIQADEENNPFFASREQQVEESFNPTASPKDYSQLGQVEAIGIDNASTVIHIPLVHPTLSQPMQSLRTYPQSKERPDILRRSDTLDLERKAPIAILSILTSTVPYPHNLVQSLKLLGPHLATSFAISQQFSSTRLQGVTIKHRRTANGRSISTAPMTIVPTSLDDIMNAEVEEVPNTTSGSVTTPSDRSGPSPYSSTSSIVGTPGWDPATHGWTTSKSAAGTPALTGTEIVDNYFEAKKRSSHRASSNASTQAQSTPARVLKKVSSSERKKGVRKSSSPVDSHSRVPQSEHRLAAGATVREEVSPGTHSSTREQSPPRSPQPGSSQRPSMRHSASHVIESASQRWQSQLHSHGADLETSFGGLPPTLTAQPTTPGAPGHARKHSYPEDMPPPSERLLRTIIDSVPVQIFTAEPDTGKLTWLNSKFMVYRGLEARQLLNEPWEAIHPEDRSDFMAAWHRSLRTAQQLQQKVRLQRFDGSYRWFYVRAAPLRDKHQKIVHWIGTMMDFHEQNLAQETASKQHEIAASEAKYRALANSSPQIVFAVNKTKGITFCNTQWVQFSGQTEVQARGVGFMDHVHPDDLVKCKLPTFEDGSMYPKNVPTSVPPDLSRKASDTLSSSTSSTETERVVSSPDTTPLTAHLPQRKLSELASTGILKVSRDADGRPSYSTEVRLKSKEGDYRWHLVRVLLAEPLLQKGEDEGTWYGTCTDIDDHKALERHLKETMDEKSRFLSNMSHEIRTPLNGISGMVNFLIDSSLTTEQMEHVNIIRSSTEGLRGLINDILDLSKAEAGMIHLNLDWLYVRALIEEVNDLTSAMAIDKGLELNYLVEEDVPSQIKGDRFRIRQILLNIIGNAIKFTTRGEVFIHCSLHESDDYDLAQNELYVKFEVIDTGRGFTNEDAEHLFKRFSQIDGSSTRQHGGTGLGLVISRQLAQLHGGDMRATGILGKGSTFTCFIKTTLPSKLDQPPTPLLTPGGVSVPIFPMSPVATVPKVPPIPLQAAYQAKPSPKFGTEQTQSPSPYATSPDVGRESPSVSSVGSGGSLISATRTSSLNSHRSSMSSFMPDAAGQSPPIMLSMPSDMKANAKHPQESKLSTFETADYLSSQSSNNSSEESVTPRATAGISPGGSMMPPMYSILVLSPLKYSREATVQHIDKTLPKNVPHQITARETLSECQKMIGAEDPVIFTHIVVVLQDIDEITALMNQVYRSSAHQATCIVIITDFAQRRRIMDHAPNYDYDELQSQRRLRFIFKPLKPSRFASIFDPQKEREMSYDRNYDSAQQIAVTQKQVFEELGKRLGNKDKRVLLVEDNRTNQLVVLKFLAKVSIAAETVVDGVECTDKVFSKPHGYYSIILCDLHMPNKDGYQTCKEIRIWERENMYPHLPIIALSANVLGDVHEKCVASGFNSYLTKPVDFKELSTVLMAFMDPSDPSKPHEFMKMKRGKSGR